MVSSFSHSLLLPAPPRLLGLDLETLKTTGRIFVEQTSVWFWTEAFLWLDSAAVFARDLTKVSLVHSFIRNMSRGPCTDHLVMAVPASFSFVKIPGSSV